MNIGQVCIKLAGRDAGKSAIIIDIIDDNFVMIDGNTRRKRCNIRHLEPLDMVAKIGKNAPTKDVLAALKSLNLPVREEAMFSKEQKIQKKEEKAKKAKKK